MGRKRGGLFDFNRDGKESIGEMYVAYQMYQKWLKRKEAKETGTASYAPSFDDEPDDSWRDFCEDGSEFGIDPYDYDTEEEYEEALQEADFAAQRDYWDSMEYEMDLNYTL